MEEKHLSPPPTPQDHTSHKHSVQWPGPQGTPSTFRASYTLCGLRGRAEPGPRLAHGPDLDEVLFPPAQLSMGLPGGEGGQTWWALSLDLTLPLPSTHAPFLHPLQADADQAVPAPHVVDK